MRYHEDFENAHSLEYFEKFLTDARFYLMGGGAASTGAVGKTLDITGGKFPEGQVIEGNKKLKDKAEKLLYFEKFVADLPTIQVPGRWGIGDVDLVKALSRLYRKSGHYTEASHRTHRLLLHSSGRSNRP